MIACVSALFVYPIKGCRGVAVESAVVEARGLRHDRWWMLVHADTGGFLSQRSHPEMARIHVIVAADATLDVTYRREFVAVPFVPDAQLPRTVATIWSYTGYVPDCGREAASFFSDLMRVAVRLARAPDDFGRRVSPRYAAAPGDGTGFADGFPVLLTTEASLADLNQRLENPVPMNRFRSNIVVSGDVSLWTEDNWETVRVGDAYFRAVKPCERCIVTTIAQDTGANTGAEPLATLATFRRDVQSGKVLFGENLIPEVSSVGRTVSVGDAVTV